MATILIVDDEPEVRNVCRTALEYAGFAVQVAETGTEALKIVRDRAPEVVVCDLRLPGMSGAETVLRLMSIEPATRVIVTSGDGGVLADAADLFEALENLVILIKPFRLAQLVEAVHRELDVERR